MIWEIKSEFVWLMMGIMSVLFRNGPLQPNILGILGSGDRHGDVGHGDEGHHDGVHGGVGHGGVVHGGDAEEGGDGDDAGCDGQLHAQPALCDAHSRPYDADCWLCSGRQHKVHYCVMAGKSISCLFNSLFRLSKRNIKATHV